MATGLEGRNAIPCFRALSSSQSDTHIRFVSFSRRRRHTCTANNGASSGLNPVAAMTMARTHNALVVHGSDGTSRNGERDVAGGVVDEAPSLAKLVPTPRCGW